MARCLARCRLHVICTLHVACDMHVAVCIVCCTLLHVACCIVCTDREGLVTECGLFAVLAALSPKARQSVGCRRRRSRRHRDNGRTRSAQSSRRSRHATCNTQQHATCNMQHEIGTSTSSRRCRRRVSSGSSRLLPHNCAEYTQYAETTSVACCTASCTIDAATSWRTK